MTPDAAQSRAADDPGARLARQEGALLLLLAHLAGRAVRARVELEDLLQEVYLRALADPRAWPPAEPADAAFTRWLGRIARHVVVDVARAIRAAKRDGREEPLARSDWSRGGASEPRAHAPGPPTAALAGEARARLVRSFQALGAEHRRVIGLRRFEGLSAREAARRMGRGEVAVHSLYRRALAAWQEGLERLA